MVEHHPDTEFSLDLGIDCRCVRCKVRRDVLPDAEMTVHDKDSLTYIVVTPEPCDCGEKRVRVKVELGF
jgi:hypothetical protein